MDENEKNLNEENTEAVEETAAVEESEAVEETAAENVVEESTGDVPVVEEEAPAADFSSIAEAAAEKQPKNNKPLIIAVVVIIVAALIALIGYNSYQSSKYKALFDNDGYISMDGRSIQDLADYMGMSTEKYLSKYGNPYNQQGYIDTSGRTVEKVAEDMGVELSEFLETYSLPSDMPADTTESAAYYSMTMSAYAAMYGMTYDQLKEYISFPDEVNENTSLGTAEGLLPLNEYCGEDYVEEFKAEYGLGDDVTGETLYKDVREQVDTKLKEQREAEEAAEAAATEEPEETEEDTAADDTADDAAIVDDAAAADDTAVADDTAAAE